MPRQRFTQTALEEHFVSVQRTGAYARKGGSRTKILRRDVAWPSSIRGNDSCHEWDRPDGGRNTP